MIKRSAVAVWLIVTGCGATEPEQPESEQTGSLEMTDIVYAPDGPTGDVEAIRFSRAPSDVYGGSNARQLSVAAFFTQELGSAKSAEARLSATTRFARHLFDSAFLPDATDDRSLYWARLFMRQTVQPGLARQGVDPAEMVELLTALEWHSRGMALEARIARARGEGADRIVVITGFDPFFLDVDITQSNPSGLAALALDGSNIEVGRETIRIVSAIFPVRFQDFDEGLVERFVDEVVDANPDLLITISMGRDGFDLERFPGLRRSATAPDNRNVLTGASADNPIKAELGGLAIDGPEFVEFSLPAMAMTTCDSGPFEVRDNRTVTTLEAGQFEAVSLAQLKGHTAVEGSGGGYLSNEISYRALRALQSIGSTIPAGHLHTPRVTGFDPETEQVIVGQIRALIGCAVRGLQDE